MTDGISTTQRVLKFFAGWPIVGRLWEVPKSALREAAREVGLATAYGTMPFWFLPLISPFFLSGTLSTWRAFSNGELFIYSAALVGPVVYMTTKRHGRFRVPREVDDRENESQLTYIFPLGTSAINFAIVICVLSGFVFALQRIGGKLSAKVGLVPNETGIVWLSVGIAVLGTMLLFSVTSYRNMLENLDREHGDTISRSLANEEDETFDAWQESKRHD